MANSRAWMGALLLIAVLFAAVSSGSLWIDEGDTASYATQPGLASWARHLHQDQAADCQFPLYMFLVWAWAKAVGSSEYALRSLNVIFAGAALACFFVVGRMLKQPRLWLALLIQPFFWFYLNEARPYMLQLAAGSLLVTAFLMLLDGPETPRGWRLMLAGAVLLFYSTMLAPVTLGVYLMILWVLARRGEVCLPRNWFRWAAVAAAVSVPGVVYYIGTVLRGAGGARIWSVGAANFAWIYYEIAGAVGLGPPVWQLRDLARETLAGGISAHALAPLALPGFLCLLVATVFLLGWWNSRLRQENRRIAFLLVLLFVSVFAVLAAMALVMQKPVWARHLAPVFPAYALAFYLLLAQLWRSIPAGNLNWRRLVAGSCAILLIISSVLLVFSPKQAKDDYRLAARMALTALGQGKVVWWAASWHAGAYYGLPIAEGKSRSPRLEVLMGPTARDLAALNPPDLVLLSRKDVFDSAASIRKFCEQNGYKANPIQPNVFVAWQISIPDSSD